MHDLVERRTLDAGGGVRIGERVRGHCAQDDAGQAKKACGNLPNLGQRCHEFSRQQDKLIEHNTNCVGRQAAMRCT